MLSLFFSYAHEDEDFRDQLEIHLASLKRQGIISTWHDRRILVGQDFSGQISEHLEKDGIILLLVSPYFIASDYCYNNEMKRAMERHEEGAAIVIPVIIHPCDWHDLPFGKLLACPKDGKPISKYANIHDAFLEVTHAIKDAASKLLSNKETEKIESQASDKKKIEIINTLSARSSNLRIKKEFSDLDKNKFLISAFEYIANYFESSLVELKARNKDIETDFRRVDANRFMAAIYVKGKEKSKCNIWLSDGQSYVTGILYSYGGFREGSYNESINVENDDYTIYLKSLGFHYGQNKEEKMTFEGGAEYFWAMFIERLQ